MPSSGECLRHRPGGRHGWRFRKEKQTLTKHNFYIAFSWWTNAKKLSNLETRQGPSTHVLGATSPNPHPCTTSQVESSNTFWAFKRSKQTKIWKVIKLEWSPQKPVAHIWASSGYLVKDIIPPTLAHHCLVIIEKMDSRFSPAAASAPSLPVCLLAPPSLPLLGNCFPCVTVDLGKYVLYSSTLSRRARRQLAVTGDKGLSRACGSRRVREQGRHGRFH